MIAHFDDFCLWVYVLVNDMCKELEGHLSRAYVSAAGQKQGK